MKKNITLLVLFLITNYYFGQNNVLHAGETDWPNDDIKLSQNALKTTQIMSCAANTVFTTGYPAWTNYYAGYMFKVNNTSICSITINCFEARFQGTSGYRIYTKTGTFIGFELLSGSWTLVGGITSGLVSISTTTCTPIPIVANVTIPPGTSQSFYLTRTDNITTNRHLYVAGVGTAGTTVYASDANVQITEAEYLNPYFGPLQIGSRRPNFNMYYDVVCGVLSIELLSFEVIKQSDNSNLLKWSTATEKNNDYFLIERSLDAINFHALEKITGAGNSAQKLNYYYKDNFSPEGIVYYRLETVDYDGKIETSNIVAIENENTNKNPIKILNILGQEVESGYNGVVFMYYSNGTVIKKVIQ